MVESKRISDRLADALINAVIAALGLLCLLPLLNTLAMSLSATHMAEAGLVSFWPREFTLASYETILRESAFFRAIGISALRVLLGGGLQFVMTILLAFPLSHSAGEFRFRNAYMWFVVCVMLLPGSLIPWYIVLSKLGLTNSIWGLVLPGAVPIWNAVLLMNFFRSLPKALEEAAVIDGADPWRILAKIYLPISLPALATVTLFSVVGIWNEFFNAMVLMNDVGNYPLATYISQMVSAQKDLMNISDPEEIARLASISGRTLSSAKIFVAMLPVLLVYPFLQRFFVTGIVIGAVKE